MSQPLSRRSVLRAIGLGAAAVAVPSLATACGSPSSTPGGTGAGGPVAWPAYVPFNGPAPDLPGTPDYQPGYTKYPGNIVSTGQGTPGDGSTVKAWLISYGAPPKPAAENQFWQAINKALGVNLELTIIPNADYQAKVQTLTAGGDLPDLICVFGGIGLPRDTQFLPAECADLSEYLAGDAIKAYPHLANIPTYSWQAMGKVAGRIYGVPIQRSPAPSSLFINQEKFAAAGYTGTWGKDDFAKVAKALTADKAYALGASTDIPFLFNFHAASFGAPNNWKNEGGKFTSVWESEEFKAALGNMRDLWQAGVYYPDSVTTSQANIQTQFFSQGVASIFGNIGASAPAISGINGAFTLDLAQLYQGGSTPGKAWGFNGIFGYTALKKAPKERIQMLLKILDYLASPFGTKEFELLHYGVEGVHFTRDDSGAPVPTTLWTSGENLTNLPIKYIADAPGVLYFPGLPAEKITRLFDWQTKAVSAGLSFDASRGLKSETQSRQGVTLYKMITDGMTGIVTGRDSLDKWESVVKDWKSAGGDAIADEYAKYAAANS